MLNCLASPKSAYIHVPFCRHRCGYCDFTLVAKRDDLIEAYLDAIAVEMSSLQHPRAVDTIFIGGGTPTHLSPQQLDQFLKLVRQWFEPSPNCEFSSEANPLDLTDERLQILAENGVNRISLGIQSFNDVALEVLERDHRVAELGEINERVRRYFDNVSFDLIFGVPGQSRQQWQDSLEAAIRLQPNHISTYGLTFEKGTAFWTRKDRGELLPVHESLEADMYDDAIRLLDAAGIKQYEISNFAADGFECRHNEVYWRGLPYFAFGPGAASYVDGYRRTNHRSVTTWLKRIQEGESPVDVEEQLTPEERAREAIVIGLRRNQGIDRNEFQALTGFDLEQLIGTEIQRAIKNGNLRDDDRAVSLTSQGRLLYDSVIVDFL